MRISDSRLSSKQLHRTRRDGWTPARQIGFLDALASARSVTKAAASVGMSRESAYRLRARDEGALFAAIWERTLGPAPHPAREGHARPLSDGRLARLIGNQFRRGDGDFSAIGATHGKRARI